MVKRSGFPVVVHVLVFRDEALLLLRRAHTGLFDGHWAPPGGHLEAAELPSATAVRELREETALELSPAALQPVALLHYGAGGGGLNLLFATRAGAVLEPRFDPGSADALEWWPLAALPAARVPWLDAALEAAAGPRWYDEGL